MCGGGGAGEVGGCVCVHILCLFLHFWALVEVVGGRGKKEGEKETDNPVSNLSGTIIQLSPQVCYGN